MTRAAWDKAWRRSRYVAHQDRLAGESCVICGSTEKIERDHSDPRTKTYNVSQMYTHSEEVFLAELAKTLPLCRACHVGKYSLYLLTDGTTKAIKDIGRNADIDLSEAIWIGFATSGKLVYRSPFDGEMQVRMV